MSIGSHPAFQSNTLASSTNIPTSAGNPLEIEDNTLQDISSIDVSNTTGGVVHIYLGSNTALKLLMIVPGIASGIAIMQRAPVVIPKGSRISVRNGAAAALNTGNFIINGWV